MLGYGCLINWWSTSSRTTRPGPAHDLPQDLELMVTPNKRDESIPECRSSLFGQVQRRAFLARDFEVALGVLRQGASMDQHVEHSACNVFRHVGHQAALSQQPEDVGPASNLGPLAQARLGVGRLARGRHGGWQLARALSIAPGRVSLQSPASAGRDPRGRRPSCSAPTGGPTPPGPAAGPGSCGRAWLQTYGARRAGAQFRDMPPAPSRFPAASPRAACSSAGRSPLETADLVGSPLDKRTDALGGPG